MLLNKMNEITKEIFNESDYENEEDVLKFIKEYKEYDFIGFELESDEYMYKRMNFYKGTCGYKDAEKSFELQLKIKLLDELIKKEDDNEECIKLINEFNLNRALQIKNENNLYFMQNSGKIKDF